MHKRTPQKWTKYSLFNHKIQLHSSQPYTHKLLETLFMLDIHSFVWSKALQSPRGVKLETSVVVMEETAYVVNMPPTGAVLWSTDCFDSRWLHSFFIGCHSLWNVPHIRFYLLRVVEFSCTVMYAMCTLYPTFLFYVLTFHDSWYANTAL